MRFAAALALVAALALAPLGAQAGSLSVDKVTMVAPGGSGTTAETVAKLIAPGMSRVLGKPGTRAAAIEQLAAQSGQQVDFITAVALVHEASGVLRRHVDVTRVRFRALTTAEIERYVDAEAAFDCAGSFKSEGLGITLVDAIDSEDATGLVGLPLIAVRRLLADIGQPLP